MPDKQVLLQPAMAAGRGAPPGGRYTYQWEGCNSIWGCTGITGATKSTYVVPEEAEGFMIRVKVTATNSAGSASAISKETSEVA